MQVFLLPDYIIVGVILRRQDAWILLARLGNDYSHICDTI
jgi:hypothetical protein